MDKSGRKLENWVTFDGDFTWFIGTWAFSASILLLSLGPFLLRPGKWRSSRNHKQEDAFSEGKKAWEDVSPWETTLGPLRINNHVPSLFGHNKKSRSGPEWRAKGEEEEET